MQPAITCFQDLEYIIIKILSPDPLLPRAREGLSRALPQELGNPQFENPG
jgi:hypothetical protein